MICKEKGIRCKNKLSYYRTCCGKESPKRINEKPVYWKNVTCPECLKHSPYGAAYMKRYYKGCVKIRKALVKVIKIETPKEPDMNKFREYWSNK